MIPAFIVVSRDGARAYDDAGTWLETAVDSELTADECRAQFPNICVVEVRAEPPQVAEMARLNAIYTRRLAAGLTIEQALGIEP